MKYDLEETIIAAMMNHELLIIVEGQDDIKFYSNIAEKNNVQADVKAVEIIDGYTEGCEKVIEALENAKQLFVKDSRLKKHIMGVIDRDVRQYRHTLPEIDNLLVLKYYSYETHLINIKSISNMIKLLTRVSGDMITMNVINYVVDQFNKSNKELYYFSLEALKNSCTVNYNADITYNDDYGKFIGKGKEYSWRCISSKKEDLDLFAAQYGVTRNDLKMITKGKWYLGIWCDFLIHFSESLYEKCGDELPSCCYCDSGNRKKCLWRKKVSYQVPELEAYLVELSLPIEEVSYIVSFMKTIIADSNMVERLIGSSAKVEREVC